ncbi:hypothetical protein HK405_008953 [Cladochytrium tenue]|nr:hypothetical protein HK405_008953 [Cladochytrium tenue]
MLPINYNLFAGTVRYHHASGCQSLDADAPPVDPDSVVVLGSAGKFITAVAALQLVDRGLINLDDPVAPILPELARIPVIVASDSAGATPEASGADLGAPTFILRPPRSQITLRQLLTHSAGVPAQDDPHPLLQAWRNSPEATASRPPADAPVIVRMFSEPLVFDPGCGWRYGACIHWLTLLVARLSGAPRFVDAIRTNVFEPLGMQSSTYDITTRSDLSARLMQMVNRTAASDGNQGVLEPADDLPLGLVTSVSDLTKILSDLVSPTPRLLSLASADIFAAPAFAPSSDALRDLQNSPEDYPAYAGISKSPLPLTAPRPPVNFSPGGLVVDFSGVPEAGDDARLPKSGIPHGAVTWDGMANVVWAARRGTTGHPGMATIFATQVLPVHDPVTVDITSKFMHDAWNTYCPKPGAD